MEKDYQPHIFRIQRYSIHDGPGIRTTLFFQGCPLSCPWCHNPESQPMTDLNGWVKEDDNTGLLNGLPEEGQNLVERLVREIKKDQIYYEESGGGVTFSGGEPLLRPGLLMALLSECQSLGFHTCLDTSGFAPAQVLEKAALASDLVLYDVKIMDNAIHKKIVGQTLDIILENLKLLDRLKVPVKLRFPLIPGMTDTQESIQALIAFLTGQTGYRDIHILPFHNIGKGKYKGLGIDDPMKDILSPGPDQVEAVAQQFEQSGFNTVIGG